MDDREFDRLPNPFAPFANEKRQSKQDLVSALKWFALVTVLFVIVTAGQHYFRRFRQSGLVAAFDRADSQQKIQQLARFAQSSNDPIGNITAALGDPDANVSNAAANLLSGMRHQWSTLAPDEACYRRKRFAAELDKVISQIDTRDDRRLAPIRTLAHLVAQDMIGTDGVDDRESYQILMRAMSVGKLEPSDEQVSTIARRPIPMDSVGEIPASWTDWPPPSTQSSDSRSHQTVLSIEGQSPILGQVDSQAASTGLEPRLIRPTIDLEPQTESAIKQDAAAKPVGQAALGHWIRELNSPSRLARLKAVNELAEIGNDSALVALRMRLQIESNSTVVDQINLCLKR